MITKAMKKTPNGPGMLQEVCWLLPIGVRAPVHVSLSTRQTTWGAKERATPCPVDYLRVLTGVLKTDAFSLVSAWANGMVMDYLVGFLDWCLKAGEKS